MQPRFAARRSLAAFAASWSDWRPHPARVPDACACSSNRRPVNFEGEYLEDSSMSRRLQIPALGLGVFLAAATATAGAATHLAYGSGPKAHYTVQAQPGAGRCHYRFTRPHQPLPDRKCTPGALNPKVSPRTIGSTICRSGYTARIRPPESITGPEKRANARSYGYKGSLGVAEYDHLVPLELGGDPNDGKNLWVEPPSPGHRASSGVINPKDSVESQARALVCEHRVSLTAMQNAIAANWTTAIAVVTHAPTGGTHHGPLSCTARVSNARPAQYSTVVVYISTKGGASVVTTAHYKTKDTQKAARANGAGAASVVYSISRATKGYTVVVVVSVALGGVNAECRTSFTPV